MTTTRSQGENSQSQGASAPGSQLPPNTNNTPPQVEDQTGGETPGQGEPATGTGIPPNLTQDQQISFLFNAYMAMKKDNEVREKKDAEQRQKDAQKALENALPTKSKKTSNMILPLFHCVRKENHKPPSRFIKQNWRGRKGNQIKDSRLRYPYPVYMTQSCLHLIWSHRSKSLSTQPTLSLNILP